jgi:branched-chain amino acid transport system permease protein
MSGQAALLFAVRHRTGLTVCALTLLLAGLPWLLTDPWRQGLLNVIGLHAIVVLGLNLFVGYAGQISLGHAAFFGLGAYGSGVLTTALDVPPALALLLTGIGVALAALLIGIPTLRLSGHYLAMATLGFNVIVHHLLVQWDSVTGGPSGLTGIPGFAAFGLPVRGEVAHHYLIWGTAMLALTLSVNLVRSGVGRGLAALAEDETAATALGVDVRRGKIGVFAVSALYASVAGSLFAHYLGTITPDTFSIFASIDFVIMVVIGGVGSLWGSLAGAAAVTLLPHLLGPLEEYKEILYGLVVVGILLVFPRGLLSGLMDQARLALARSGMANGK